MAEFFTPNAANDGRFGSVQDDSENDNEPRSPLETAHEFATLALAAADAAEYDQAYKFCLLIAPESETDADEVIQIKQLRDSTKTYIDGLINNT